MSKLVTGSPELKRAVLEALLDKREAREPDALASEMAGESAGELAGSQAARRSRSFAADVRDAARVLGCSERTIWRWVDRGDVPGANGQSWKPKPEYQDLLLRHDGSIAALCEALVAAGEESISIRTAQRGFERHSPTVQVVYAKKGFQGARGHLPTSRMPDRALNEEWCMDDTQLPVWCILPSGEIGKAQAEGIIESCTRAIVGLTVSPYKFNTEDAVENLATAMSGHHTPDGVFIGGKPASLRSDRGSNFTATATTLGLIAEDVARVYSFPYTPEQDGKIERWHQFKGRLKRLPGFDWTEYKQGDPRKAAEVPPADQVLLFEELVAEVLVEVRTYNYERVHSAHGLTPIACWEREVAADPDSVQPANALAIRASMKQSDDRVINNRRIRWDNRWYNLHPQSVLDEDEDPDVISIRRNLIDAAEGAEVEFRFLPQRVEYVSVYNKRGEYLGDAVWDEIQTVQQAGETAQTRRRHIKVMRTSMEEIARADAAAIARRRQDALDSAEAGDEQYAQYDSPETATTSTAPTSDTSGCDTSGSDDPIAVPEPAPGQPGSSASRKSYTKKPPKSQAPKSDGSTSTPATKPTRAELAREQARRDAEEAANYQRHRSA